MLSVDSNKSDKGLSEVEDEDEPALSVDLKMLEEEVEGEVKPVMSVDSKRWNKG